MYKQEWDSSPYSYTYVEELEHFKKNVPVKAIQEAAYTLIHMIHPTADPVVMYGEWWKELADWLRDIDEE